MFPTAFLWLAWCGSAANYLLLGLTRLTAAKITQPYLPVM